MPVIMMADWPRRRRPGAIAVTVPPRPRHPGPGRSPWHGVSSSTESSCDCRLSLAVTAIMMAASDPSHVTLPVHILLYGLLYSLVYSLYVI